MVFEGVIHGLSHFQLCGTVLIAADHAFVKESAGAEDGEHGRLIGNGTFTRLTLFQFVLRRLPDGLRRQLRRRGFLVQRGVKALGNCRSYLADVGWNRFGSAFSQKACLNSPIFVQFFNDITLVRSAKGARKAQTGSGPSFGAVSSWAPRVIPVRCGWSARARVFLGNS
jgi:hypothetical protein